MKILFLTDSLSLPRENNEFESVTFEQTYLHKLRMSYKDDVIIDCAIGGARISELKSQCFYYKFFEPDIVFIQSGIVDCCPRAYSKLTAKVINKLGLRSKMKKVNFFLRKYRNYTFTSKNKFRDTLIEIKNLFPKSTFYSIGIINGIEGYEQIVPGVKKNINEYNLILKQNTKYIDISSVGIDDIMKDYHHLNILGHKKLFSLIKNEISSFKK
tara:strand:+ start:8829 stop:9467 length:639 start_codon:yes stop_codon:yes gene_type:complete